MTILAPPARTHVMHVIDTGGPGGAEAMYADIACGLRSRGIRNTAIVGRDDWLCQQLRSTGIEPLVLPAEGSFNVSYLRRLVDRVRSEQPDVIIAHMLGPAIYCSIAGFLTSRPTIAIFHGQSDFPSTEGLAWLKAATIRHCARRVVFVSEKLRSALIARLLLPQEKICVIHNGIDADKIAAATAAPLRAQLDLPDDAFLIGAVGNIRRPKGYDVLMRAARLAIDREPRLRFVVAGDTSTPLFLPLLELRDRLELTHHFHFLGFRSDSASVLKALDAYVLSSTTEGFSIACCEAMAAGIPIVATRSGGPEQILDDGNCGILVSPGDPNELAEGLVLLANSRTERQRVTSAAITRVKANYSASRMIDAYAALISRVRLSR